MMEVSRKKREKKTTILFGKIKEKIPQWRLIDKRGKIWQAWRRGSQITIETLLKEGVDIKKLMMLSIFIVFGLVGGGVNFSQADEPGNKIINDIVEGYSVNLSKIKNGSCTEIVTSAGTGFLPGGQINHYKATHTLKFSGPYLRWEHMDSRKITSADGKIIKEIKGLTYDTYIDKEKGICYGFIGENRYEIRNIDSSNTTGDLKLYRVMPQEYGTPLYLLQAKGLTNKFIRYEDVNGRCCAIIESKRTGKKITTIVHIWVDAESYLVLKEKHWMQESASGKVMPVYETELQITCCDKENNIFGPKVFKEIRYKYPNFSTGKSELSEEKIVKFNDLIYNINIKQSDLVMAIPKGAKVIDYMAGGVGYTVP